MKIKFKDSLVIIISKTLNICQFHERTTKDVMGVFFGFEIFIFFENYSYKQTQFFDFFQKATGMCVCVCVCVYGLMTNKFVPHFKYWLPFLLTSLLAPYPINWISLGIVPFSRSNSKIETLILNYLISFQFHTLLILRLSQIIIHFDQT